MDTNTTMKKTKNTESRVKQKKLEVRQEVKIIQLIVFNLGDEEFGADISQVRDVVRVGSITGIPDSPDFIKGITNVRGEIAVVIDLKKRFSLKKRKGVEEKHIVMTVQEKNLYGLVVDEVTEVLRMPETAIITTPALVTRIDRVYLSGVITLEKRLIMMLDLSKVLSEDELTKLSEIRLRYHATENGKPERKDQTESDDWQELKIEEKAEMELESVGTN